MRADADSTDLTQSAHKTSQGRAGVTPKLRVRKSAGDLDAPVFEWVGSKRGYVWVGNDMDAEKSARPGRCAITMSAANARKLRDWLTERLGDE